MSDKSETKKFRVTLRQLAFLTAIGGVVWMVLSLAGFLSFGGSVVMLMIAMAIGFRSHSIFRSYTFTAWVLVCVGLAVVYPQMLQEWWGYKLTRLIVPLVQVIMFGMGTTLSLKDFTRVLLAPWPVLVGVILQFCIMPLVGYFVAISFGFEGELAAGIILIGSVSGGVASNLMAYIAGANVALSVTMTCVSTLTAPLMTPLLMRVFAGRFVPIDTVAMMLSILNMILIPVVAGLIAHSILYSPKKWVSRIDRLLIVIVSAVAIATIAIVIKPEFFGIFASLKQGVFLGSSLVAIVSIIKLIFGVFLGKPNTWMDRVLPLVSMFGICVILTVITAQTYDVLMQVGLMLICAAVIHNAAGYGLGYWGARLCGSLLGRIGYKLGLLTTPETIIKEVDCRTVAFEVGMQNGGMATGLAVDVLKSHIAALPPNVFGTWMNISGSMLANWWKRKDAKKKK